MPALLCNVWVPAEVLEHIAYALVAVTPLGPPKDLVPFLQASRDIYRALSVHSGTTLYARICRLKFDVGAVTRRAFNPRTRDLNDHLIQMCELLQFISVGNVDHEDAVDYMISAFIAMLDNDGKNRAQLEHVRIEAFVDRFIQFRLDEGRPQNDMWPIESSHNTCALWLSWMLTTQKKLETETPAQREAFLGLLFPFVMCPYRYASAYAPSNHFLLPLGETNPIQKQMLSVPTVHGPFPVYHTERQGTVVLHHFRTDTPVLLPPITAVAKLLYWCRHEVPPFHHVPLHPPQVLPHLDGHSPQITQDSLIGSTFHKAARLPEVVRWDWEEGRPLKGSEQGSPKPCFSASSQCWDMDWWRMRMCRSVFDPQPRWRLGPVYLRGLLSGVWEGVYFVVDEETINELLRRPQCPADLSPRSTPFKPQPLVMDLQEHGFIRMPALEARRPFPTSAGREKDPSCHPTSLPIPPASPQFIRAYPILPPSEQLEPRGILVPIDGSSDNAWLPGPVGSLRWTTGPAFDIGTINPPLHHSTTLREQGLCSNPDATTQGRRPTAADMESVRFFVPSDHCTRVSASHSESSLAAGSYVYETYDPGKRSVHEGMVHAHEEGLYLRGAASMDVSSNQEDVARHPGCLRCVDRESYLAARRQRHRQLVARRQESRRLAEISFSSIGMGKRGYSMENSPSASGFEDDDDDDDDTDESSDVFDFDVGMGARTDCGEDDDVDVDEDEDSRSRSSSPTSPPQSDDDEKEDMDATRLSYDHGRPGGLDDPMDLEVPPLRRAHDRYRVAPCDHGVEDTIITGQLPDISSQSQLRVVYYGRVRPWDGLIAILKQEILGDQFTNCLFYGYIYNGQNFVGNWRFGGQDPLEPGLESCFIMSRR